MIILGIVLSLVPAALWPSVPKIIPEKQIGTAFALIYWVQNIGFIVVPFIVGHVLDKFCKRTTPDGVPAYDYTLVMIIFSVISLLSIFVAFALKKEDKRMGYGLEKKNLTD
jgi:MFS family permease